MASLRHPAGSDAPRPVSPVGYPPLRPTGFQLEMHLQKEEKLNYMNYLEVLCHKKLFFKFGMNLQMHILER